MKAFANKKGFTLVEVIVTLVILSILGSVAVSAYTQYYERAREKICLIDRGQATNHYIAYTILEGIPESESSFQEFLADDSFFGQSMCPTTGTYSWNLTKHRCECSVHGGQTAQLNLTSMKEEDATATAQQLIDQFLNFYKGYTNDPTNRIPNFNRFLSFAEADSESSDGNSVLKRMMMQSFIDYIGQEDFSTASGKIKELYIFAGKDDNGKFDASNVTGVYLKLKNPTGNGSNNTIIYYSDGTYVIGRDLKRDSYFDADGNKIQG